MFGNIIFFNKTKINDYKAFINETKNLKFEKVRISNDKTIDGKIPIISGGVKESKTYEALIEESLLFENNEFENLLTGRDDYFDFTRSSDIDIKSMTRGVIIKFDGNICIPKSFDLTQLIMQFKPMLMDSISKNMDSNEQEAFKTVFSSAKVQIPIITACDNYSLCGKIDPKNLNVEYTQLEEFEDEEEVTIIARVSSNLEIPKSKPIFDPLKDFMNMNRSFRRTAAIDPPEGLKPIFNDSDYKSIEILSIYQ